MRGVSLGNSLVRVTEVILSWLVTIAKVTGQVMVGLMAIVIVVGVVSRYVFGAPLAFPDEFTGYLMVGISIIAANWILRDGGHVSVDAGVMLLPQKAQAWLTVITDMITVFCIAFILIQVSKITGQSLISHTTSTTTIRTPIGLIQLMLPIGFGLLLVELLRTTVISLKSAFLLSRSEGPQKGTDQ